MAYKGKFRKKLDHIFARNILIVYFPIHCKTPVEFYKILLYLFFTFTIFIFTSLTLFYIMLKAQVKKECSHCHIWWLLSKA